MTAATGVNTISASPKVFSETLRNITGDRLTMLVKSVRNDTTRKTVKKPILNDLGFFFISSRI